MKANKKNDNVVSEMLFDIIVSVLVFVGIMVGGSFINKTENKETIESTMSTEATELKEEVNDLLESEMVQEWLYQDIMDALFVESEGVEL